MSCDSYIIGELEALELLERLHYGRRENNLIPQHHGL